MIFKNIFEDLNISKNDYFYLFILTVFSILITYNLIILNENIGIYCSDVFIYLSNSLVFAGFKTSRVYLYLSPFIQPFFIPLINAHPNIAVHEVSANDSLSFTT